MHRLLLAAAAMVIPSLVTPAWAQFAPAGSTISTAVTNAQTLSAGTGTVTSAGSITTSSGTVGVTMSGSATLNNGGVIQQTGSGRAVDSNTNNISLVIQNSGSILAAGADAMRVNTANTGITLTNSGTISTGGDGQAVDWAAIATAANALTNTATGVISAVGDDAVRPGHNGTINNAGSITATPTVSGGSASGSDGIDLRTQKTVTVTNTGSITGRHGIAPDGANVGPSSQAVYNNAGTIQGLNGSGLNVDANTALPSATTVTATVTNAFGATIRGGVLAATTAGDGDGIDIDGVLTLTNSGDILGYGAKGASNNPEGIAAGGGSIINTATGRIIGSATLADAPNGDSTKIGSGILVDDSNGGSAVAATTITNSGLIEGKSGFAIKINGTFANSVTNEAGGTLRGASAGAALQTGDGVDTVINRGAIIGTGGNAIDLRGGNDSLTIQGGSASVSGNISGGTGTNTMTINPGAGNSFSYAGSISNFSSVEVQSGTVTLSGANTYTGVTRISGGVLQLDGANRVAAASALFLDGGTLQMANIGAADGQTFASLALNESSVLDLGFTTTLTSTTWVRWSRARRWRSSTTWPRCRLIMRSGSWAT
jgi:autotransporter-associated beta strand protein